MSEKAKITLKQERTIVVPMLPNFIRSADGASIPIADLTEEHATEIGKAWTEAFVRKVRLHRGGRMRELNRKLSGH